MPGATGDPPRSAVVDLLRTPRRNKREVSDSSRWQKQDPGRAVAPPTSRAICSATNPSPESSGNTTAPGTPLEATGCDRGSFPGNPRARSAKSPAQPTVDQQGWRLEITPICPCDGILHLISTGTDSANSGRIVTRARVVRQRRLWRKPSRSRQRRAGDFTRQRVHPPPERDARLERSISPSGVPRRRSATP